MSEILPDILPGRIILVVAASHRTSRGVMADITARLALMGSVTVIDSGNSFDSFRIARSIRQYTHELKNALQRIQIARAFTCYQVIALLEQTPTTSQPLLILDFLTNFYDEDVPVSECSRLLHESMHHIRRLSQTAPVIVSTRPPRVEQLDRLVLFEQFREISENVFIFGQPEILPPLKLF